ncbi:adenylate/guanylate cyclase domain-containing protein [Bradyrhizobium sp. TZ2]
MESALPKRKLAAILAADVVGYSRLMARDEAGTLARLQAHRCELIDPKITEHSGRIVKLMGDGALVEFASVVDAVECAIAIQQGMREINAGHPEDQRVVFRIGINLGDIIIEGDDIYGDGVNIAARLEGIAEPGGISISEDAWRQVYGKVAVSFVDIGEQKLKNMARPLRVYRVDLGEASWLRPAPPALSLPDKPSIAVLPFDNISSDVDQEFFADGLAEDITTLSKLAGLRVVARNSSFVYKRRAVDVREVARQLVCDMSWRAASARQATASASRLSLSMPRAARTCGPNAMTVQWTTFLRSRTKSRWSWQLRCRSNSRKANRHGWVTGRQAMSSSGPTGSADCSTTAKRSRRRHWGPRVSIGRRRSRLTRIRRCLTPCSELCTTSTRFGWWDDRETSHCQSACIC